MMRSLSSAVSGMRNHQTRMDVIGSNIANVNTTAFKSSRATFREMLVQQAVAPGRPTDGRGGSNAIQIGIGMTVGSIDTNFSQGFLETTGRTTDLAIQGDGFFMVRQNDVVSYTRAGSFSLDAAGRLVAPGGQIVQGYGADAAGTILTNAPLQDIVVPRVTNPAQATTEADLLGNLDSRALVGDTKAVPLTVYDSLGNSQVVTVTFTKTAANSWSWSAADPSGGPAGTGTATFNADGSLNTFTGGVSYTPTTGADPINVTINAAGVGGLTQYSADATAYARLVDGYMAGTLESFAIDPNGVVNATFSNGNTLALGQLALATFTNPEGLSREAGSLYSESVNSGDARIILPGQSNTTTIAAGSLEGSNVNLTEEFTQMIGAQRGFQASARVITTSDEMLAEIANLKR